MLIGLSLSLVTPKSIIALEGDPASDPQTLSVNEFVRDLIVYDADIANGNNIAVIPVSGLADAPDGTTIEVRARSVEDAGATSSPWQTMVIEAGGWSGTLDVPRNDTAWYQVEARLPTAPAVTARSTSRFGTGLVFLVSEQSLMQYILLAGSAGDFTETIGGNGDNFQLFRIVNPTENPAPIEGPLFVQDGTPEGSPVTQAIKAMAAFFHKNAPGLKVSVLFDVKVGEGQFRTLSNSNPERNWPNIPALIETAIPGSTDVGLALVTHRYSQIENSNMAELQSAMWLGRDLDGTPYPGIADPTQPLPARVSFGAFGIDHTWSEAMPGLQTGRTIIGTGYTAMHWGTRESNRETERTWRREMADWSAAFPGTVRVAPIPLPTTRDAADTLHPTRFYDNGTANRARGLAYKALFTAGLVPREVPRWDNVNWTENYLEVWSDAGPAGTHARIADANFTNYPEDVETAPSTPGDQEVIGFMDDDLSRYRTEIWPYDGSDRAAYIAANGNPPPAGRVRVYPPAGQIFTGTSRVFYGLGTYGDERSNNANHRAGLLDHLAVVDMGLQGGDYGSGVYVHPHEWDSRDPFAAEYFMQAPSYGALPVPDGFVPLNLTDGSFAPLSTRFEENTTISEVSQLTFEIAFVHTGRRLDLLSLSERNSTNTKKGNRGGALVVYDDGRVLATLKNSAANSGIVLIDTANADTSPLLNLAVNEEYTLRFEYDRLNGQAGQARLYVNGTLHATVAIDAGALDTTRDSGWLIRPSSDDYNGQVGYARLWYDIGTGGDAPTSNVYAGLEKDSGALVLRTNYAVP